MAKTRAKLRRIGARWYVFLSGRRRFSTGCYDEKAARLVAIQIERAQVILDILKDDASGSLERLLAEHLSARGAIVKDKKPVGTKGRVYFVECKARGLIKIGFTTDMLKRMRSLKTSATDELTLIGSFEATRRREQSLHQRHLKQRKFGEWFLDCPEVRESIAEYLECKPAESHTASKRTKRL